MCVLTASVFVDAIVVIYVYLLVNTHIKPGVHTTDYWFLIICSLSVRGTTKGGNVATKTHSLWEMLGRMQLSLFAIRNSRLSIILFKGLHT